MKIKRWFILAGGSATRWEGYLGHKNKCYLEIDGESLVDRTIRLLEENGVNNYEVVLDGYKSKREAFEGIAKEAQCPFGILLGDCYYTEAIIKDATHRDETEWKHYYNCLPNQWTGCGWEEGYIHLVPNWEWWLGKMTEFNRKCESGEIQFYKDYQIDRYLRGYSTEEYRGATLDEHDIYWNDETDDFDYPSDYDKFMERHEANKNGFRADRLSIIITNYNNDNYLRILLQTLQNQIRSYPETEVIVVNDGSDNKIQWVHEYGAQEIEQPNKGVSGARNTGLMAAHGRYISFIDADDNVEPDYVHTLYTIMRKGYDYAVFPFWACSEGAVGRVRDELIGNYAVWAWCFTWNIIGDERFDENLNVAEDVDWLRRVILPELKGHRSDKYIYRYDWNANPNSLSKRFNRGDLPHKKSDNASKS